MQALCTSSKETAFLVSSQIWSNPFFALPHIIFVDSFSKWASNTLVSPCFLSTSMWIKTKTELEITIYLCLQYSALLEPRSPFHFYLSWNNSEIFFCFLHWFCGRLIASENVFISHLMIFWEPLIFLRFGNCVFQ